MIYVFSRKERISKEFSHQFHKKSISNTWDCFWVDGMDGCIEVRAFSKKNIVCGYFNDKNLFVDSVCSLSPKCDGVYCTMNMVNEELLALYPINTMIGTWREKKAGIGDFFIEGSLMTTSDNDVPKESCFIIDVDPKRKSSISSSDEQLSKAYSKACELSDYLIERGIPNQLGCSGNGFHIIVRMIPEDFTLERQIKRKTLMEWFADNFSDEYLDIDRKVFNPARIIKIYGTAVRKGINFPQQSRFHRLSFLNTVPEKTDNLYKEFNGESTPAPKAPSNFMKKLDVEKMMIDAGISFRKKQSKGEFWELEDCPNSPGQHKPWEAHVRIDEQGRYCFSCFHNRCAWNWHDFRAHCESISGKSSGARIAKNFDREEMLRSQQELRKLL